MIPRTQERFRYRYRLPKKTHCRESMVTAENKIIIPLFCQSYYLIFLNPIYKRICTHVKCTFIEFQANIMSTGKSGACMTAIACHNSAETEENSFSFLMLIKE